MLTPAEASSYIGDKACARCHLDIYREYVGTRHAQTLRAISFKKDSPYFSRAKTVIDWITGQRYTPTTKNGKCIIHGADRMSNGDLPVDYVIGSGRNARTFFTATRPDAWLDLRISYYTRAHRWDFTPTQEPGRRADQLAPGIWQAGAQLPNCLLCHVTYLQEGPLGIDVANSRLGIGCERCHGPGRAHVEHFTPMDDLTDSTPDQINRLCGSCHHDPTNSPAGDPKTENGLPRFEGVALARSRCYIDSKTLSCVTCHDPHGNSRSDPAYYDAICLRCHNSLSASHPKSGIQPVFRTANAVCPVNPRNGCTNCHMPAQTIPTIPYARYHNHWIKVWTPGAKRQPTSLSEAADAGRDER